MPGIGIEAAIALPAMAACCFAEPVARSAAQQHSQRRRGGSCVTKCHYPNVFLSLRQRKSSGTRGYARWRKYAVMARWSAFRENLRPWLLLRQRKVVGAAAGGPYHKSGDRSQTGAHACATVPETEANRIRVFARCPRLLARGWAGAPVAAELGGASWPAHIHPPPDNAPWRARGCPA